jgi:hypothetical protein
MNEMKNIRAHWHLVNVSLSLSTVTSLCFIVTATLRKCRIGPYETDDMVSSKIGEIQKRNFEKETE